MDKVAIHPLCYFDHGGANTEPVPQCSFCSILRIYMAGIDLNYFCGILSGISPETDHPIRIRGYSTDSNCNIIVNINLLVCK